MSYDYLVAYKKSEVEKVIRSYNKIKLSADTEGAKEKFPNYFKEEETPNMGGIAHSDQPEKFNSPFADLFKPKCNVIPAEKIASNKKTTNQYYSTTIKDDFDCLDKLKLSAPIFGELANGSVPYCFLQFKFTLKKSYISRDDDPFYCLVNENPIRKDKVFKVPMISETTWKGHLRDAMRIKKKYDDNNPILCRLFGNHRKAENNFRMGRLRLYPTFFNDIGLEVINPHDRKTGVGKNPIYFECVPAETSGYFSLLYFPFDLIGNENVEEIKPDICHILDAVKSMFLEYGFSAKKLAGYGVAKDGEFKDVNCQSNILDNTEKEKLKADINKWPKDEGGGK